MTRHNLSITNISVDGFHRFMNPALRGKAPDHGWLHSRYYQCSTDTSSSSPEHVQCMPRRSDNTWPDRYLFPGLPGKTVNPLPESTKKLLYDTIALHDLRPGAILARMRPDPVPVALPWQYQYEHQASNGRTSDRKGSGSEVGSIDDSTIFCCHHNIYHQLLAVIGVQLFPVLPEALNYHAETEEMIKQACASLISLTNLPDQPVGQSLSLKDLPNPDHKNSMFPVGVFWRNFMIPVLAALYFCSQILADNQHRKRLYCSWPGGDPPLQFSVLWSGIALSSGLYCACLVQCLYNLHQRRTSLSDDIPNEIFRQKFVPLSLATIFHIPEWADCQHRTGFSFSEHEKHWRQRSTQEICRQIHSNIRDRK